MAQAPAPRLKRRERKNITAGVAHVNASFNNTMITITDAQGNAISWSSAGMMGFKGSRKSTPYAAQVAAEDAGKKAAEHGVRRQDGFAPETLAAPDCDLLGVLAGGIGEFDARAASEQLVLSLQAALLLRAGSPAAAAFVGHCYHVWLRFRGGKGVATLMGVALGLHWPLGLIFAVLWLGLLALTRVSSLAGMSAAIGMPVAAAMLASMAAWSALPSEGVSVTASWPPPRLSRMWRTVNFCDE